MEVSAFWELLEKLGSEYQEVHTERDTLLKHPSLVGSYIPKSIERPRTAGPFDQKAVQNGSPFSTAVSTPRPRTPRTPRICPVQAPQPKSHAVADMSVGDGISSPFRDGNGLRKESRCSSTSSDMNGLCFPDAWTPKPTSGTIRSHSQIDTRSQSDAARISLWSVWIENERPQTISTQISSMGENRRRLPGEANAPKVGDALLGNGCWQSIIVRPSSRERLIWEFTTLWFLAYDVLFVPLMAFQLPDTDFSRFMSILIAVFWTFDMFFTFFVGFHYEGVIEMRPDKIAHRYLKGWFLFDVLIILTDWSSILLTTAADPAGLTRATKSLRVARVFRAFRLIRVAKVLSIIKEFDRLFQSETSIIIFGMIKFIIFILMINHYIACGWYAVGEYHPYQSDHTWVQKFIDDSGREQSQMTTLYKYTTSLHWSFTQFTTASMEVAPENSLERIYSIIVVFFALLIFSSFVSQITALVTTHRNKNSERTRQAECVRTYLSAKGLSLELGNRVLTFLKTHRRPLQTHITELDVIAFKRLPEQLLVDLHAEVYMPLIGTHPFFHHFQLIDERSLVHLCHVATGEVALAKGCNLFSLGQEATKMYFVNEGSLNYFFRERGCEPEHVPEKTYVCDVALWVRWHFQGFMVVSDDTSNIFELDLAEFQTVMLNSVALPSCRRFALLYVERIRSWPEEELNGMPLSLLDLCLDFDSLQEMAQVAFEEQLDVEHGSKNLSRFRLARKLNSSFISLNTVATVVARTWARACLPRFRCCGKALT